VKKIVSGMAHITGGGIVGNLNRALPDDVDAVVDKSAWDVPGVFGFLQKHGRVDEEEMFRVFNMGIGYTLVVRPTFANSVVRHLNRLGEDARVIGRVESGSGLVRMV
jgi:phosphoribosylformylglycinamidine cyclo-ligase